MICLDLAPSFGMDRDTETGTNSVVDSIWPRQLTAMSQLDVLKLEEDSMAGYLRVDALAVNLTFIFRK